MKKCEGCEVSKKVESYECWASGLGFVALLVLVFFVGRCSVMDKEHSVDVTVAMDKTYNMNLALKDEMFATRTVCVDTYVGLKGETINCAAACRVNK